MKIYRFGKARLATIMLQHVRGACLLFAVAVTIGSCLHCSADLITDDFSVNKRANYDRVNIWNSTGVEAWNIVSGEQRMNAAIDGTVAYMWNNPNLKLFSLGDYAQVDFRIDAERNSFGSAASLYLAPAIGTGGWEIGNVYQSAANPDNRLEITGNSTLHLTNGLPNWTTLKAELTTVNGANSIYTVTLTGGLSASKTLTAPAGLYFGFATYNTNGSNVRMDNFQAQATNFAVPEPSGLSLIGLGLAGSVMRRRRRS